MKRIEKKDGGNLPVTPARNGAASLPGRQPKKAALDYRKAANVGKSARTARFDEDPKMASFLMVRILKDNPNPGPDVAQGNSKTREDGGEPSKKNYPNTPKPAGNSNKETGNDTGNDTGNAREKNVKKDLTGKMPRENRSPLLPSQFLEIIR